MFLRQPPRKASSQKEAEKLRSDARREIGPPPPDKALAGRMNAHGIPVFYGAFSENLAVAEVRPYVGGLIVVGQFAVIRELKLLDLAEFVRSYFPGSMFAPGYYERASQLKFLREFVAIISRPVQPHEEILEYVATQAVAEYLANELGFDGILYPSAQLGGTLSDDDDDYYVIDDQSIEERLASKNVALFNATGIVEEETKPEDEAGREETPFDDGPLTMDRLLQHIIAESQHDEEFAIQPSKPPSLQYVKNSAQITKVTGMKVDYAVL